jgi:hypothetical protein
MSGTLICEWNNSDNQKNWGRCYDHNFLQFFPIFGEKFGVFLKYQCYDQFFQNLALFWVKNVNFLLNFSAKIFQKIITLVPVFFTSHRCQHYLVSFLKKISMPPLVKGCYWKYKKWANEEIETMLPNCGDHH